MILDDQQFSSLDTVFARFLCERTKFNGIQKKAFEKLVMTLSFEQGQGHSCIHLDGEDRALVHASGLAALHSEAGGGE